MILISMILCAWNYFMLNKKWREYNFQDKYQKFKYEFMMNNNEKIIT